MNEFKISPEEFETLEDFGERSHEVRSWLSENNYSILKGLDSEVFHIWFENYSYCRGNEIPR